MVWIDFQRVLAMLTRLVRFSVLNQDIGKVRTAHRIIRMSCNRFGKESSGLYLVSGGEQKLSETIQGSQMRGLKSKHLNKGGPRFLAPAHLFQDAAPQKKESD